MARRRQYALLRQLPRGMTLSPSAAAGTTTKPRPGPRPGRTEQAETHGHLLNVESARVGPLPAPAPKTAVK